MAEIEYRNRSISQLVSELNHLGDPTVLLSPLRLTAVHEKDLPEVKRFKNSQGQQFFIPNNTQKKFPYAEITHSVSGPQLEAMQDLYLRGFNLSLVFALPREQGRLTQLLSEVVKMVGDCAVSPAQFSEQGITETVGGCRLSERDFDGRLKYYRVEEGSLIAFLDRMLRPHPRAAVALVKLRSLQGNNPSAN
jgi:hypothetical protein